MTSPGSQTLWLNALDHLPHANYPHAILYLSLSRGASPERAYRVLQQGLMRTFAQLPWLSGKVHPISPDAAKMSLEVQYDHQQEGAGDGEGFPYQLRYNELGDDAVSYEELRESAFHPTAFADEALTWAPFVPDLRRDAEVFVAQANFLPGACLLAAAMCHAVGDGVAINAVLKLWGENCESLQRGLAAEPLPAEISDHRLLEQLYAREGSGRPGGEIPPDTWHLLGLSPPADGEAENKKDASVSRDEVESRAAPVPELKACLFYIPWDNVTALRDDCRDPSQEADLSFNDVLCALIWRSLLRARVEARRQRREEKGDEGEEEEEEEEEARLDLPFDCRAYFPEAVPPGYLGNFTMINQVRRPLAQLTSGADSIASVARAIRGVADRATPARLLDAYRLVGERSGEEASLTLDNLRVGGSGLIVTSFVTFATDSVSFGGGAFGNGGRPDAMRSMMGAISRVFRYCAILPRKKSGGVEFVATLSDEELELLERDSEFTKYAMFVS